MKVLDTKQLAELRKAGKITQVAVEQTKNGESTSYLDMAVLSSLIVTSNEAIRTSQETNRQAMLVMQEALNIMAVQRPPVDAPAVYMPPFPAFPEPLPPPKAWKFDIERNNSGLINSVVATRVDEVENDG